jgi:hypothetical protein
MIRPILAILLLSLAVGAIPAADASPAACGVAIDRAIQVPSPGCEPCLMIYTQPPDVDFGCLEGP